MRQCGCRPLSCASLPVARRPHRRIIALDEPTVLHKAWKADRWTDSQEDRETDGQIGGERDKQEDRERQTGGQTERKTGRQADRQRDRRVDR